VAAAGVGCGCGTAGVCGAEAGRGACLNSGVIGAADAGTGGVAKSVGDVAPVSGFVDVGVGSAAFVSAFGGRSNRGRRSEGFRSVASEIKNESPIFDSLIARRASFLKAGLSALMGDTSSKVSKERRTRVGVCGLLKKRGITIDQSNVSIANSKHDKKFLSPLFPFQQTKSASKKRLLRFRMVRIKDLGFFS